MLKIKDLVKGKKPPCARCLYTLGLVKTLRDPCSECKLNGYQMYEIFRGYTGKPGSADPE